MFFGVTRVDNYTDFLLSLPAERAVNPAQTLGKTYSGQID